ncbi:dTDP-4-dehydrorhamnose 3,5-epimerase family protein, partial [Aeromonas veronii]|uniref:dTDP-4-dehydrorhamnose 3,5-epimerase family protein n=1 Tax=Aeromonas veronii TaxID=654 RepID=UPI00224558DC
FLTLSESAEFLYKTTNYYAPQCEGSICWNDPQVGIEWPIDGEVSLSKKDQEAVSLQLATVFDLV